MGYAENSASRVRAIIRPWGRTLLPVAVVAVALGLAISSNSGDSLTVDEITHIPAGYSYLARNDFRMNPEHPPLAKDLAAIPLLFATLNQDAFQRDAWKRGYATQISFGVDLLFKTGNDADQIAFLARTPMLLFYLLACILIFAWTRERYGYWPAVIGLVLFAYSPTVLAHSRLVTTDAAALWGTLTSIFFFLRFLRKPAWRRLVIAGLFFGAALLTKFSAVLLAPFFLCAALLDLIARAAGVHEAFKTLGATLVALLLGVLLVVWPVYLGHTWNYPPELQRQQTLEILGPANQEPIAKLVAYLSDVPGLRALGQYGLGLVMANSTRGAGTTVYFLGQVRPAGVLAYFPALYLLKETLAWWLLALLALAVAALNSIASFRRRSGFNIRPWIRSHFEACVMLGWLMLYWALGLNSTLNIGIRHMLPAFPFAIMLVSGRLGELLIRTRDAGPRFAAPRRALVRGLLFLALSWHVYAAIGIHPLYLTYYNELAGGAGNGYRIAVDSNLDWGQDLKRLGLFMRENQVDTIELCLFAIPGTTQYYTGYPEDRRLLMLPEKYPNELAFLSLNKSDGWAAISATQKMWRQNTPESNFDWLDNYEPEALVGNSIFVYHVKRSARRWRTSKELGR